MTFTIFALPSQDALKLSFSGVGARDVEAANSSITSASTPITSASNKAWTLSEPGL